MDRALLNYKMKKANLTNKDVAERLSIDVATFVRKKSGLSDFKRGEIQIIIEMLNLTLQETNDIFFN